MKNSPILYYICFFDKLGLDCKFLYGDATDKIEVTNFWKNLTDTDGYASIDVLNYKKNNTLHHNSLHCFPVHDNCGPGDAPQVSHIAVLITESYEIHHSAECAEMIEDKELEEVGLPLDRREECNVYPHHNALPPPPLSNWLSFTDCLPLALMLRYMLRSQAPIVLTDRFKTSLYNLFVSPHFAFVFFLMHFSN